MVMKGFVVSLDESTKMNADFRKVIYTGKTSQLVLMCLDPGEDIGMEVHKNIDQFFRFESGDGEVIIDGVRHKVYDGVGVIIPAGAEHNVVNTGMASLKFYTIYSPPEHKDKVVRRTKADALADLEEYDGNPTE